MFQTEIKNYWKDSQNFITIQCLEWLDVSNAACNAYNKLYIRRALCFYHQLGNLCSGLCEFVCSAACSLCILKCTVFYAVYLTVTHTHIYTVLQYTQTSRFTQMRNDSFIKRPSGKKAQIHTWSSEGSGKLNFPTWQMTYSVLTSWTVLENWIQQKCQ